MIRGWQGIEYKLNTVGSSRGDYPFVTVTLGLGMKIILRKCAAFLFWRFTRAVREEKDITGAVSENRIPL